MKDADGLALFAMADPVHSSRRPVADAPQPPAEKPLAEMIRAGEAPRPTLSTSTKDKLARSLGAAALLSYTEMGFEPRDVTIKAGQTMRFTNNSNRDMWIAAAASAGEQLYPGIANGCGFSALDSCGAIAPQDFWQFTFTVKGTWRVVNTLDPLRTAIVHVN
jgi:plastocyanin